MSHFEFVILASSVSCPSCNEVFATHTPFKMSEMKTTLPVEADLHRVLPYGAVRGCLVSVCPQCQYTWWTNTFNRHHFLPVGISETPNIDYPKKFAHAVLTGRRNNFHILDRALLALNGYWCAKEDKQETKKWLALAIQELAGALNTADWQSNRSRYQYILAELLRLNENFEESIKAFDLVDNKANLPQDLIENQTNLAKNKNSDTTLLTNKQVKQIFFPKLLDEVYTVEEQLGPIQLAAKFLAEIAAKNNTPSSIETKSTTVPSRRPQLEIA